MDFAVQRRRLMRASCAVAALAGLLLCAVALSHALAAGGGVGAAGGSSLAEASATGAVHVRDLAGRVLGGEGVLSGELEAKDEAPGWFADELFSLAGEEGVMASGDWTVVGFSADCGAQEALEDVAARLQARGWVGYESGAPGIATFSKEGGTCSWAMVSCAQMPEGTSVVVRVQRAA